MELYEDILSKQIGALVLEHMNGRGFDYDEIVESASYAALERIRAVVYDEGLTDFECVEEIVRIFEDIGSSGGGRHDF